MIRYFRSLCFALAIAAVMGCGAQLVSAAPAQKGTAQADTRGNPSTKVWVNTKSHVYHCPGTRYYGNTKNGDYMTQAEAQKMGSRPAYGKYCS